MGPLQEHSTEIETRYFLQRKITDHPFFKTTPTNRLEISKSHCTLSYIKSELTASRDIIAMWVLTAVHGSIQQICTVLYCTEEALAVHVMSTTEQCWPVICKDTVISKHYKNSPNARCQQAQEPQISPSGRNRFSASSSPAAPPVMSRTVQSTFCQFPSRTSLWLVDGPISGQSAVAMVPHVK